MKLSTGIFSADVRFLMGVSSVDGFPGTNMHEFAFIGRSNVGKSSLINALLNRKDVARVSNTPGRTQQVNLFSIGGEIMFSDLPGYGYASVSKKLRSGWDRLITLYLRGRPQLKRAFLLVDSRRGYTELDREIMEFLDDCAVSYQIVLTKIDKIKNLPEVEESIIAANASFSAVHPRVLKTSSQLRLGLDELRQSILEVANHDR